MSLCEVLYNIMKSDVCDGHGGSGQLNEVMTHMNESCHISIRHAAYESVRSHMNESCHM